MQRFDLFGGSVTLTTQRKEKFSTSFGALFSLLFLGCIVASIWYYFRLFLDSENNPQIQSNVEYSTAYNRKNLGLFQNTFFVGIFKGGKFVDFEDIPKYGFVNLKQVKRKIGKNGVHSPEIDKTFPLVKCTKEFPDLKTTSVLYEQYKDKLACMKDIEQFALEGQQADSTNPYEAWSITFHKCAGPHCVSDNDLKRSLFVVQAGSHNIISNNFKEPFTTKDYPLFDPVQTTQETIYSYYYQEIEVQDDVGFERSWFGSKNKVGLNYSVVRAERSSNIRDTSNDALCYHPVTLQYTCWQPLVTVNFKNTNEKLTINRSYKTMLEVVSDIGGIAGLFLGLFEIINAFHNGLQMGYFQVKEILGKEIMKNNDLGSIWKLVQAKSCCFCSKKKREQMRKRLEFFDTGSEIVQENLDSITIIKNMVKLQLISSVFFSQQMDYLIPFMILKFKREELKQQEATEKLKKDQQRRKKRCCDSKPSQVSNQKKANNQIISQQNMIKDQNPDFNPDKQKSLGSFYNILSALSYNVAVTQLQKGKAKNNTMQEIQKEMLSKLQEDEQQQQIGQQSQQSKSQAKINNGNIEMQRLNGSQGNKVKQVLFGPQDDIKEFQDFDSNVHDTKKFVMTNPQQQQKQNELRWDQVQ